MPELFVIRSTSQTLLLTSVGIEDATLAGVLSDLL